MLCYVVLSIISHSIQDLPPCWRKAGEVVAVMTTVLAHFVLCRNVAFLKAQCSDFGVLAMSTIFLVLQASPVSAAPADNLGMIVCY